MNERLSSEERIRRKRDFIDLYRDGHRLRGRYFTLVYRSGPLGHSRLAVVVSKKVGPAVVRNRVKRRIRDIFRRTKNLIVEPTDIIVVTRKEILELTPAELRAGYLQAIEAIKRKQASS
jgi:ribonuclease P protein component